MHIQGKGYGTATIKQEVALAHQTLGKKPILVVDIGGNIGNYTAELLRLYPDLEIHLFEPAQTNIAKLKERFAGNATVHIVPCAVSHQTGDAALFSNTPGSGLASLTKRDLEHHHLTFDWQEPIQTLRFEDYWNTVLQRRALDLVKIDVEGHELDVLNGFGAAINAVEVVQFEFGGCNIDTRTFFRDFWQFFQKHGFKIFRITPIGLQPIKRYKELEECFSTTNFIARKTV